MAIRRDKAIQLLRHAGAKARRFSKDRSTQVGAVFASPGDYTILSEGYNGMPRGADDEKAERHERPMKYLYTEHSERNAIYNKVQSLLAGCIVVTTAAPTFQCVRAAISVGASEFVMPRRLDFNDEHLLMASLLAETGVRVRYYSWGGPLGESLIFDANDDGGDRHHRKLQQNLLYARDCTEIWGKDPQASSTVILAPGSYTVLTLGFSGMPRGADDSKASRYLTDERAFWVETSVCNAIYNAARPLLQGSVLTCTYVPCAECARALIQVGVVAVIAIEPTADFLERWATQIEQSASQFRECGIELITIPESEIRGGLSLETLGVGL